MFVSEGILRQLPHITGYFRNHQSGTDQMKPLLRSAIAVLCLPIAKSIPQWVGFTIKLSKPHFHLQGYCTVICGRCWAIHTPVFNRSACIFCEIIGKLGCHLVIIVTTIIFFITIQAQQRNKRRTALIHERITRLNISGRIVIRHGRTIVITGP